jgi:predicted unusual protein kinase regulating ubiquinone biosynthesis (AarF/ABC1/UbiB family)
MKISLKPQHLKRYGEIARLLLRYGKSDVVSELALEGIDPQALPSSPDAPRPEQLADDLERMGPTFVKLGQILSSRADLLPDAYLKALSRLQDNVKPFPYEEVEEVVTRELGARISKAFASFEHEPLAAASLGQVHRATLRDGRAVCVKVQRPGIRKVIAEDMEALNEIMGLISLTRFGRQYQVHRIFEEFKHTLIQELDYTREAANMVTICENLREFDLIYVPAPIQSFCTQNVLTMEFVEGQKITSMTPLGRMDFDGHALADQLFHSYLKQVLVDGVFHADPHPGNVFITPDHKIALLDLGMVGRTTPHMQEQLIKLLVAVSEGNSDRACEIAIQISETTPNFDETAFRKRGGQLIAENQNSSISQIDIGRLLLEVTRSAGQSGLYAPTDLTLLGKTLLQLDEIGRFIDPNFNPNAAIRDKVTEILNRRMRQQATTGRMFSSLLELKEFAATLPTRLNKILDSVANAELEVRVRAVDANLFMTGFQKVANRIATGVITAALIIGAALLMQVQTTFTVFGYPGLAMLCFIAAAAVGFYLVFSILIQDFRDKKRTNDL